MREISNPRSGIPHGFHRSAASFLFLAVAACALFLACQNTAPPVWPWWTAADRSAAENELNTWRDTISVRQFVENAVEPFTESTGIPARDSTSLTGAPIIKIRRLTGFGLFTPDTALRDSLLFGVTDDSLPTDTFYTDTFCYVTAVDSSLKALQFMDYDQFWRINYYSIMKIDSSGTPWETTYTYRLDTLATHLVDSVREDQKDAPFQVQRYVQLEKAPGKSQYAFSRMSGYSLYTPTTADAPAIRSLIITYLGRTDTFHLSAQLSHLGIYNLRDKDSLYSVKTNNPVQISVQTDKPALKGDVFDYILRVGGRRASLARDSLPATLTTTFTQAGIYNVAVEVIPESNLLYPAGDFKITVWSLPILVTE